MILELILIAVAAGLIGTAIILAMITVSAIKQCVRGWWGSGTNVTVVNPSTTAKLERIAREKGSKRHKRFIYNKKTGATKMVESNSISDKLASKKKVKLYVS